MKRARGREGGGCETIPDNAEDALGTENILGWGVAINEVFQTGKVKLDSQIGSTRSCMESCK